MEQGKATLLSIGGILVIFSIVLPFVLFASADGFEGVIGAFFFLLVVSPILFLVGIGLLIGGAVRGRGQQQQQQVVIMSESQANARGINRHCHQCGAAVGGSQRFCNACGGVTHG